MGSRAWEDPNADVEPGTKVGQSELALEDKLGIRGNRSVAGSWGLEILPAGPGSHAEALAVRALNIEATFQREAL